MEKYKRNMDYIEKNNPWLLLKWIKRFRAYTHTHTHKKKTYKYKRKMCYHQKNNSDVKTFKRLKNIKES